jgi:hypothetical protein
MSFEKWLYLFHLDTAVEPQYDESIINDDAALYAYAFCAVTRDSHRNAKFRNMSLRPEWK